MRQALAGMLWSKQCYFFDVDQWLRERGVHPLRAPRRRGTRNESWFHMFNHDIVSMPDKWEYPWYAAWDLAFHCIPLAMVDPDFAKSQIDLMLSQELPAPERPDPRLRVELRRREPAGARVRDAVPAQPGGRPGRVGLAVPGGVLPRLLLNFTWWVNRKDPTGRNVFEGGFLGLDNIGVFDRSAALPTGGSLEQADGTAWMAMFSQNMLELALALVEHDPSYEEFVLKFVEHFFWIAAAIDPVGEHPDEMWDEEDGFFYDVLRLPDGSGTRLKVRSLVGLLPLCATTVIEADVIERYPEVAARVGAFLDRNQDLLANIADPLRAGRQRPAAAVAGQRGQAAADPGADARRGALPRPPRHPLDLALAPRPPVRLRRRTAPSTACSTSRPSRPRGMFGGNSNWRGPVWFPINVLLIRALLQHYRYYGDELKVECPTGSGTMMTLFEVAQELSRRLVGDVPARRATGAARSTAGPRCSRRTRTGGT